MQMRCCHNDVILDSNWSAREVLLRYYIFVLCLKEKIHEMKENIGLGALINHYEHGLVTNRR